MKLKSKIVKIPSGLTEAQLETKLDSYLNVGWELKQVFSYGTSTYAVFVKVLVQ